MCGNILVVYPPSGQVEDHIPGRPLAVSERVRYLNYFIVSFNQDFFWTQLLPPRGGRGLLFRAAGVLLRPGTEQNSVTTTWLGHH